MKILELKDLTVKIGNSLILENINLEVNEGELIAIVGPNGGGKTTLLKTCLGFIKPTKGYVKLLGEPPKEAVKTGKVGYLPQKPVLPTKTYLSALDVVLFGFIHSKLPKKEKIKEALEILKIVGMEKHANKHYSDLSGGQQQRVSIGRVIAQDPKIIFLDEPSTGVDVVAQESFYKFLKRLRDEKNITIVMVTHDVGTVAEFVDKVVGLNKYMHYLGDIKGFFQKDILEKLYGTEVKLLVHSPECVSCEHFHMDFKR